MTEPTIRLLDTSRDLRRLGAVLDQIWGVRTPIVNPELMRAIGHAGGYVAAAFDGDQIVGGSVAFLARHRGEPALHSHVTGVVSGVRGTGLGRRIKLHQRWWAAEQGLRWVTWTFDPLVRRNAWFNLTVLGARVEAYLVDFYGPIDDALNASDESDRLLVAWAVAGDDEATTQSGTAGAPAPSPAASTPDAGSRGSEATTQSGTAGAPAPSPAASTTDPFTVPTPPDIVSLRRTDPADAEAWRRRVRVELGGPLDLGAHVVGFTSDGNYLVAPGGGQ